MFFNRVIKGPAGFEAIPQRTRKSTMWGTIDTNLETPLRIVVFKRDTLEYFGSTISNADHTWRVDAHQEDTENLLAVCLDDSGTYNSDVFDKMDLCTITSNPDGSWQTWFMQGPKFRRMWRNPCHRGMFSLPVQVNFEDVKGTITKYQFDTPGTAAFWEDEYRPAGDSGRFLDDTDTPVAVGPSQTNQKIDVGSHTVWDECAPVILDTELPDWEALTRHTKIVKGIDLEVTGITGDGLSADNVKLHPAFGGKDYVKDFFSDGSCEVHLPFQRDTKESSGIETYVRDNHFNIYKSNEINSKQLYMHPYNYQHFYVDWRMQQSDYSFSFWAYLNSGYLYLFGQSRDFGIHLYGNSRQGYRNNNASGFTRVNFSWGGSPPRGVWVHYVLTLGATEAKWYENGVAVKSLTGNYQVIPYTVNVPWTWSSRFHLGLPYYKPLDWGVSCDYMNGHYRNFRIFSRLLDETEVGALYAESPGGGQKVAVDAIYNFYNGGNAFIAGRSKGEVYNALTLETPRGGFGELQGESIDQIKIEHEKAGCGKMQDIILHAGDYDGYNRRGSAMALSCNSNYRVDGLFNNSTGIGDTATFRCSGTDSYIGYSRYWHGYRFAKPVHISGLSLKIYDGSNDYATPQICLIYGSYSGDFDHDMIFLGFYHEEEIDAGYGHSYFREIRAPFPVRAIRICWWQRQNSDIDVTIQNSWLRSKIPVPLDAKVGRSIIVDIADGHGGTEVGLAGVIPMLCSCPVSTHGWSFYATSSYNTNQIPQKAFQVWNMHKSHNPGCWRSEAAVNTNQRIIAVAPEDFYYDLVRIVNYNIARVTSTLGAKNIKVQVSTDEITDTTYGAAVTNAITVFEGELKQYPALSWAQPDSLRCLEFRKPFRARAVIIDLHNNRYAGGTICFRRMDFMYQGQAISPNGWTYGANDRATSANKAFDSSYYYGGYASSYSWYSLVQPARVWVLFDQEYLIDAIQFNNSVDNDPDNAWLEVGVKDMTITYTLDASTPSNVYNDPVPGGVVYMTPMDLERRNSLGSADWCKLYAGVEQNGYWQARSVVFDFHESWGQAPMAISAIRFLMDRNRLEADDWTFYDDGHEADYPPESLMRREAFMNYSYRTAGFSWISTKPRQVRVIVVMDKAFLFNQIIYDPFKEGSHIHRRGQACCPRSVTVTITDQVLNSGHAVYGQTVPGGEVIYDGIMYPSHEIYQEDATGHLPMVVKDLVGMDRQLACLIHSDDPDGTTLFVDSSPTANQLVPAIETGGTVTHSTDQAKIGGSSIDTSLGYLVVNSMTRYALEDFPWSVGAWIYPTAVTGDTSILAKWEESSDQRAYKLSIINGYVSFKYSVTGADSYEFVSIGTISTGSWQHICVVRQGADLVIKIDGAVDSIHNIGTDALYSGAAKTLVGSHDQSVLNCFQGYVDEFEFDFLGDMNTGAFTPRTTPRSIELGMHTANCEAYFAFSFDARVSYCVWTGSAWRPIATTSDAIHGDTGSSAWHFRDNGDVWSLTGIEDTSQSALCAAVAAGGNNQMTKSQVESLTSTEWGTTGGYDSTDGFIDIGYVDYSAGDTQQGLMSIVIDGKYFWFSEEIDLEKITGTIDSSKVSWSHGYSKESEALYDNFVSAWQVHAMVTGSSAWALCSNAATIPGLANGTDTTGKKLQVRVTTNKLLVKTNMFSPEVTVEIN